MERAITSGIPTGWVELGEHPGQWVCRLRSEGEIVIEFRFTVDKQGDLVKHPQQKEVNPLMMPQNAVFSEVSLGPKQKFDFRVSIPTMRAGSSFGRPWPKAKATSAMLASYGTLTKVH